MRRSFVQEVKRILAFVVFQPIRPEQRGNFSHSLDSCEPAVGLFGLLDLGSEAELSWDGECR